MNADALASQFTASAGVVYLMNRVPYLRDWAWISKRLIAIVAALLVASGVHWTFDQTQGVLVISGLTLANVVHSVWDWAQSFTMQQLIHLNTKGTHDA